METAMKVDNFTSKCYSPDEISCGGAAGMSVTEICKRLISERGITQAEAARKTGYTKTGLNNKFARNSMRADEFIAFAEALGYEVKIVESGSEREVKARKRGIGKRLKAMVNGVRYDTYNADAICHGDGNADVFIELYIDDNGRYFVAQYAQWAGGANTISPISVEDATKMVEKYT